MSEELIEQVGGLEKLRKDCFDAVVRWQWYSGLLARDPIPHLSEACGSGKPRLLKKEPAKKDNAAKVGIDALGRTVVRQTYFVYRGTPYPHDELFHYDERRVLSVRMRTVIAGEPQRYERSEILELQDGRVVALGDSKYHYDDAGRLVRSVHRYHTTTYSYDELGQLLAAETEKETRYRRKPKGVTMSSTMKRIEELLVEQIPPVLAAHAPDEPVCCLALAHSLRMTALPPLIGLAFERERKTLMKDSDPQRAVWDPIEWELFEDDRLELRDPALLTACETAHHLCVEADTIEPVRKMLWKVVDQVAPRLPEVLTTSKHFVALALHAEHDDLLKDLKRLKRTLPPATKKALAAALP